MTLQEMIDRYKAWPGGRVNFKSVAVQLLLSMVMLIGLAAFFGGLYTYYNSPSANEATSIQLINNDIKTHNLSYECTSVVLVNQSGNNYVGSAEFSDGSRINITAVADGSRIALYYTLPDQWFAQATPVTPQPDPALSP